MSAIIAAFVIFIGSIFFAMLGLGGGMVYVPVLKWTGYAVKDVAIPLGLLLNGLNTGLALIAFARNGLVNWKIGLPISLMAMILSPLGAWVNQFVSGRYLLIGFSTLVIIAALRMLWTANKKNESKILHIGQLILFGSITGAIAGFLGGLLGIGGGFIIAPVLMAFGLEAKESAATTALAVTASSFSGYAGHVLTTMPPLELMIGTVLAVALGSQIGAMLTSRIQNGSVLKKIYAYALLIIALKLFYDVAFM